MVKYQGNKKKLATKICRIIRDKGIKKTDLWDLCCGSGEISSYWHEPNFMVDKGPWGLFWMNVQALKGNPLLPAFLNSENYPDYVKSWVHQRIPKDPLEFCYKFLALQRETFQGKPMEISFNRWKSPGFDGKFSYKQFKIAWDRAFRVKIKEAFRLDVNNLALSEGLNIYIDPDYADTTGYGNRRVDIPKVLENNPGSIIFVSHHNVIDGVRWDEIINLTNNTSGREARGSSKDESELLLIRRPV